MVRKSKPNWWLLFAILPLMIVAILVESQFKYPAQVHEVADGAIVVVSFGLMVGWMRSNEAALEEQEAAKEHWVFFEEPDEDESEEFEYPVELPTEKSLRPSSRERVDAGWGAPEGTSAKGRYN